MTGAVAVIWDEELAAYDLGPTHPLRPARVQLTIALARELGLLDAATVLPPIRTEDADLRRVHAAEYLDAVRLASHHGRPRPRFGLGPGDTPAFAGMHEAASQVCGATIRAAAVVLDGTVAHAFSPAGGLHHAMADRASGFCVYNDPAVAIAWILDHGAARVAYVDVDVHHGDGVEAAFASDPRVLTISIHESGRYLFPGTGFVDDIGVGPGQGSAVNLPLAPYTTDETYLAAFDQIVPPLIAAFDPDVLVTQLGCDTHATDPLAHLALTTAAYQGLAGRLHRLAHDAADGRWLATGGGGYQWATVVPRAWNAYLAEMLGRSLPDLAPEPFLREARSRFGVGLPEALVDPPGTPGAALEPAALERSSAEAERVVATVRRRAFGFWGA